MSGTAEAQQADFEPSRIPRCGNAAGGVWIEPVAESRLIIADTDGAVKSLKRYPSVESVLIQRLVSLRLDGRNISNGCPQKRTWRSTLADRQSTTQFQ